MWNDRITLLAHSTKKINGVSQDVFSDPVTVWANAVSVGYREFYAASSAGTTLDAAFEVHAYDYAGQQYLSYNGRIYFVPRPYRKGEGDWTLAASALQVKWP